MASPPNKHDAVFASRTWTPTGSERRCPGSVCCCGRPPGTGAMRYLPWPGGAPWPS